MNQRPEPNEYAPYYHQYISQIPDGDIRQILEDQIFETINLLKDVSETQGLFRYDTGKWSMKEAIGHIADTERIMSYRLLCFARGDSKAIPGFNENEYVLGATFDNDSIGELLDNLLSVRKSTLHLLKSLDIECWQRRGIANDVEITVRALANMIAGHEVHHRNIIFNRYMSSSCYPSK